MNIVLIYNSRSGSALSSDALQEKCDTYGITVDALIEMGDTLERDLKPYLGKDRVIAVVGGDGTISGVVNAILDVPVILAPLPGGTLNHFTKDLGIDQDIDKALRNLVNGKVRTVDVATINQKVFINNSSIGLYPSSLQTREKLEAKLGKWGAAIVGSLQALWRYRSYEVSVNGEQFKTPFIFVGNNDYHLTESGEDGRSVLNEGVLSVYAVTSASRWKLIKILAHAITGRLYMTDEIETWKTTEITIHTKKSVVKVSRDGELEYLAGPLEYKIVTGSLRVIG